VEVRACSLAKVGLSYRSQPVEVGAGANPRATNLNGGRNCQPAKE